MDRAPEDDQHKGGLEPAGNELGKDASDAEKGDDEATKVRDSEPKPKDFDLNFPAASAQSSTRAAAKLCYGQSKKSEKKLRGAARRKNSRPERFIPPTPPPTVEENEGERRRRRVVTIRAIHYDLDCDSAMSGVYGGPVTDEVQDESDSDTEVVQNNEQKQKRTQYWTARALPIDENIPVPPEEYPEPPSPPRMPKSPEKKAAFQRGTPNEGPSE